MQVLPNIYAAVVEIRENKRLHHFPSFTTQLPVQKHRHVILTASDVFVQRFKHEGTYLGPHSLYSPGPNTVRCPSVQVELTEQGLVPHQRRDLMMMNRSNGSLKQHST